MTSLLPLLTFAQTHALDAFLTGFHHEIPPMANLAGIPIIQMPPT
jgi:hypothetical protein